MNLPALKLCEGHVILDAPGEYVAFEVRLCGPHLVLEELEEVLHQLLLRKKLVYVWLPAEFDLRVRHGARVPKQEDNGHPGEVGVGPTQHKVRPNILDQTPPREEPAVEAICPTALKPPGE